jgi:hypothetical protein
MKMVSRKTLDLIDFPDYWHHNAVRFETGSKMTGQVLEV